MATAQFSSSGACGTSPARAECSPMQCGGASNVQVAAEVDRRMTAAKGILKCVQRAVAQASATRSDTLVTVPGGDGGCCWKSGGSLWLVLPGRQGVELTHVGDNLHVRFGAGWDATSTAWKNAFLVEMQMSSEVSTNVFAYMMGAATWDRMLSAARSDPQCCFLLRDQGEGRFFVVLDLTATADFDMASADRGLLRAVFGDGDDKVVCVEGGAHDVVCVEGDVVREQVPERMFEGVARVVPSQSAAEAGEGGADELGDIASQLVLDMSCLHGVAGAALAKECHEIMREGGVPILKSVITGKTDEFDRHIEVKCGKEKTIRPLLEMLTKALGHSSLLFTSEHEGSDLDVDGDVVWLSHWAPGGPGVDVVWKNGAPPEPAMVFREGDTIRIERRNMTTTAVHCWTGRRYAVCETTVQTAVATIAGGGEAAAAGGVTMRVVCADRHTFEARNGAEEAHGGVEDAAGATLSFTNPREDTVRHRIKSVREGRVVTDLGEFGNVLLSEARAEHTVETYSVKVAPGDVIFAAYLNCVDKSGVPQLVPTFACIMSLSEGEGHYKVVAHNKSLPEGLKFRSGEGVGGCTQGWNQLGHMEQVLQAVFKNRKWTLNAVSSAVNAYAARGWHFGQSMSPVTAGSPWDLAAGDTVHPCPDSGEWMKHCDGKEEVSHIESGSGLVVLKNGTTFWSPPQEGVKVEMKVGDTVRGLTLHSAVAVELICSTWPLDMQVGPGGEMQYKVLAAELHQECVELPADLQLLDVQQHRGAAFEGQVRDRHGRFWRVKGTMAQGAPPRLPARYGVRPAQDGSFDVVVGAAVIANFTLLDNDRRLMVLPSLVRVNGRAQPTPPWCRVDDHWKCHALVAASAMEPYYFPMVAENRYVTVTFQAPDGRRWVVSHLCVQDSCDVPRVVIMRPDVTTERSLDFGGSAAVFGVNTLRDPSGAPLVQLTFNGAVVPHQRVNNAQQPTQALSPCERAAIVDGRLCSVVFPCGGWRVFRVRVNRTKGGAKQGVRCCWFAVDDGQLTAVCESGHVLADLRAGTNTLWEYDRMYALQRMLEEDAPTQYMPVAAERARDAAKDLVAQMARKLLIPHVGGKTATFWPYSVLVVGQQRRPPYLLPLGNKTVGSARVGGVYNLFYCASKRTWSAAEVRQMSYPPRGGTEVRVDQCGHVVTPLLVEYHSLWRGGVPPPAGEGYVVLPGGDGVCATDGSEHLAQGPLTAVNKPRVLGRRFRVLSLLGLTPPAQHGKKPAAACAVERRERAPAAYWETSSDDDKAPPAKKAQHGGAGAAAIVATVTQLEHPAAGAEVRMSTADGREIAVEEEELSDAQADMHCVAMSNRFGEAVEGCEVLGDPKLFQGGYRKGGYRSLLRGDHHRPVPGHWGATTGPDREILKEMRMMFVSGDRVSVDGGAQGVPSVSTSTVRFPVVWSGGTYPPDGVYEVRVSSPKPKKGAAKKTSKKAADGEDAGEEVWCVLMAEGRAFKFRNVPCFHGDARHTLKRAVEWVVDHDEDVVPTRIAVVTMESVEKKASMKRKRAADDAPVVFFKVCRMEIGFQNGAGVRVLWGFEGAPPKEPKPSPFALARPEEEEEELVDASLTVVDAYGQLFQAVLVSGGREGGGGGWVYDALCKTLTSAGEPAMVVGLLGQELRVNRSELGLHWPVLRSRFEAEGVVPHEIGLDDVVVVDTGGCGDTLTVFKRLPLMGGVVEVRRSDGAVIQRLRPKGGAPPSGCTRYVQPYDLRCEGGGGFVPCAPDLLRAAASCDPCGVLVRDSAGWPLERGGFTLGVLMRYTKPPR